MIHIDGCWFKDAHGRTLLLRGVNLGGSSKVPFTPDGATHRLEGFFAHRNVSFVGRPFPLDEADAHFARLRAWGLTFLRFLITWEAIEHAGPGLYDEAYLDYVTAVVAKAREYDLQLFIDPHQDVWSRFSGGDGAPGWVFETLGMDIARFKETGAAIVHTTHGDPFPRMIWPTNYGKLAAATLFTLFFAGNDFAPQTKVAGEPVQEFLQRHYIAAVAQVAARLKDFEHVVGYDTLNEPSAGYIGCPDLAQRFGLLALGEAPTPFQSMLLGAGFPQEVEVCEMALTGLKVQERRRLNPQGVSLWREGVTPIWRQNGVWDVDAAGTPVLLRPDHFARVGDRQVDFIRDYFRPFANRFAREIRQHDARALIFVEAPPNTHDLRWGEEDARDVVHAGHWYDGLTLFTKDFRPWFTMDVEKIRPVLGRQAVQALFNAQVGAIKRVSEEAMGGVPTLVGEFGIPFDMRNGEAYRTGNFSRQVQALDMTMTTLEANLVSGTLWNYTADNTNARGDQWNGEDISIFSPDQQRGTGDVNDGGRALEAAVRPYARAVAGEPLRMSFDLRQRRFEFEFRHDPRVAAPTEFYVPRLHFPEGYGVTVSDGYCEIDLEGQTLIYHHTEAQPVHQIVVWEAGRAAAQSERSGDLVKALAVAGVLAAGGVLLARWLRRRRDE